MTEAWDDDLQMEIQRGTYRAMQRRIETLERALSPFSEMAKAMTRGGITYTIGNPRPFEIAPDGRAIIDYEHLHNARASLESDPLT